MLNEQIKAFAIKQGFQDVKEIGKYKEYTVYVPIFTDGKSRKTGYPQYILVNNNQISIKIDNDFEITNFFS
jgi:hypothetical protein